MQKSVSSVELSCFAHATEDERKVLQAIQYFIAPERIERVSFTRSKLKGEYGNPITFIKTRLEEEEITDSVLQNISLNLSTLDKETLFREQVLRSEKGKFYIRFDKQKAFTGKTKLSNVDPIRICIRFKTSKIEEIKEVCQKIGILP